MGLGFLSWAWFSEPGSAASPHTQPNLPGLGRFHRTTLIVFTQGEMDLQKYEVARRLKGVVNKIRAQYQADWRSPEMKKRQLAVALYFIDKV